MSQIGLIAHFGCRGGKPGHYMTWPNGTSVRDHEADQYKFPRDYMLDASRLFLPRPEIEHVGTLTYLPAADRTVLAWWDRTYDRRPNCNMALIVDGRRTFDEIWDAFIVKFPDLAKDVIRPTLTGSAG